MFIADIVNQQDSSLYIPTIVPHLFTVRYLLQMFILCTKPTSSIRILADLGRTLHTLRIQSLLTFSLRRSTCRVGASYKPSQLSMIK